MKRVGIAIAVSACVLLGGPVRALDFDFSGTFTQDDEVVLLGFTVGELSEITIFSSSWLEGNNTGQAVNGFDPILAIWTAGGALIEQQDDGGVTGSTLSNGVSYQHGVWDSYFTTTLSPGNYLASITQFNNFSVSANLADGFIRDGQPNFTQEYGPQPLFNGVWSQADARTGSWEFHILNVAEAQQQGVPDAASTVLLLGMAMTGIEALRRKLRG